MHNSSDTNYFASTNTRGSRTKFGIKERDRLSHMYIVGKTGTGKTTLLENLIRQDINAGRGIALLDPHGDLADKVVTTIPPHRNNDLVYFNAPDTTQPYGINPLRHVIPERRPLVASGVLELFKKMWGSSWGVQMEHILRNVILALLDQPKADLADILLLLNDKAFRANAIKNIDNAQVQYFWSEEFTQGTYQKGSALAPIQNKVGALLTDPNLNRILTRSEKPLAFRSIMDESNILIVNLAKGRIGEDSSTLLGGLIVTMLTLASFSRADTPEADRKPFYIYVDEFQNFATKSFENAVSELRKFAISLTLSNQHLHQLEQDVRYGVLGNVGTIISFRLGAKDAPLIAKEFEPYFIASDFMNLPNYHIYLKLMIGGEPSKPFSAVTLSAYYT